MTRRALPENEKRRTVAFTLPGKDIEKIEKFIAAFNERVEFPVLTKQNFLESVIQDKLCELDENRGTNKFNKSRY